MGLGVLGLAPAQYKCAAAGCFGYDSPTTSTLFRQVQEEINRVLRKMGKALIPVDGILGERTLTSLKAIANAAGVHAGAILVAAPTVAAPAERYGAIPFAELASTVSSAAAYDRLARYAPGLPTAIRAVGAYIRAVPANTPAPGPAETVPLPPMLPDGSATSAIGPTSGRKKLVYGLLAAGVLGAGLLVFLPKRKRKKAAGLKGWYR